MTRSSPLTSILQPRIAPLLARFVSRLAGHLCQIGLSLAGDIRTQLHLNMVGSSLLVVVVSQRIFASPYRPF